MATNTILTALGLDISQFEKGTTSAVGTLKPLLQGIEKVDGALRKIPVLGELYAITFGQIAKGFAETTLQAREFTRIMETDVTKSLEGARTQIDDINAALKDLKEGSLGRSLADAFKDEFNNFKAAQGAASGLGGGKFKQFLYGLAGIGTSFTQGDLAQTQAQKRSQNTVALEAKKTEVLQKSLKVIEDEAEASSAVYASSEATASFLRLQLDYEKKILAAKQEAQKHGGLDPSKWEPALKKRYDREVEIATRVNTKEKAALISRVTTRQEELLSAQRLAEIELTALAHGLNSQKTKLLLQNEEVRLAEKRAKLSKDLTSEDQQQAAAQLKILQAQQKLSVLQETMRQREIGGQGRATERANARHARREARIAQSRIDERGRNQAGQSGLRSGGIATNFLGALTPKLGSLVQPKLKAEHMNGLSSEKQIELMQKMVDLLGNLKL